MIVKTRAVVLREIKYRDQSKICLLMTREYGQLSVIVKAVRNPKSRMSGLFSAGNIIDAVIYRRSSREVQFASDASLVTSPLSQEPDLERFGVLYRILDMARHASGPEEKNLPLFSLLAGTIEQLCDSTEGFRATLARFLLRLAGVLGFEPSLNRCVFSREELLPAIRDRGVLELHFVQDPGGFALPGTAGPTGSLLQPVPAEQYLSLLAIADHNRSIPSDIDPSCLEALCGILQEYCARHMEHLPHRKHLDIVSRLVSA